MRQFQNEEVVTVKVKRDLVESANVIVSKNYEFMFVKFNGVIDDHIMSIFDNLHVETDRTALD